VLDLQLSRDVTGWRSLVGALGGRLRLNPWLGYGLAVASTVAALMLRLSVSGPLAQKYPFTTFFLAIIVTAFVAGLGPGIASTLLALLLAWYFLLPPLDHVVPDLQTAIAMAIFVAVAAVQIALIVTMQNALDRLRVERRLTTQLYVQQRTLFQELQHRVANNMAFIAATLRLQKRRIAGNPAAASFAFEEALARIDTMSRVHRRLYDPSEANRALGPHLQAVCDELVVATGSTGVAVHVDPMVFRLDLDKLVPLSLLVAELVTNSLKHAFVGRSGGTISLHLDVGDPADAVLVVRDDGIGLPGDHGADNIAGLGMRIIHGLATQVGARMETITDGGTIARIHLPG
jgi:two-component sensor histidine kinase